MPNYGKIGEITLTQKGKECDVLWKMNFSSLSKEDGAYYDSSAFEFEGDNWVLVIWPNGSQYCKSSGYIDLRLWRQSTKNPPITVESTFAIKTVNGHNIFKRRETESFQSLSYCDIEQFISTSVFVKKKSKFLVSEYLTLVCTLKRYKGNASGTTNAICSYSTKKVDEENISTHVKKCMDRPVMCPDCFDIVLLKNWLQGHECQKKKTEECSYCKKHVVARNISTHEKICIDRPIKCPKCLEDILLQNWHDHECEAATAEDETSICESF